MKYVGVDACKRGWIAIGLDEGNHWRMDVFSDIAEIWSQCKSSRLILVDIPIGLKERDSDERGCDKAARKLLGHKRGSSVFPVPCRQAVYADAKEASEVNRKVTGRKLSKQSQGIIHKIRQVDRFLQSDEAACAHIRETHPELCFLILNHGQPMEYSKKTRDGFSERLDVLVSVFPEAEELVCYAESRFPRKDVSRDDILDSLVAAITASKEILGLSTLPKDPPLDSRGLPMQMVYYSQID